MSASRLTSYFGRGKNSRPPARPCTCSKSAAAERLTGPGIKHVLRHLRVILLSACEGGETLPRHQRLRRDQDVRCFEATALPAHPVSLALWAGTLPGIPLLSFCSRHAQGLAIVAGAEGEDEGNGARGPLLRRLVRPRRTAKTTPQHVGINNTGVQRNGRHPLW